MLYTNTSAVAKTFHGVTFKPGETKDVPGYINDPDFERAKAMPKEPPKRVDSAKQKSPEVIKGSKNDSSKEEIINGSDSNQ